MENLENFENIKVFQNTIQGIIKHNKIQISHAKFLIKIVPKKCCINKYLGKT